MLILRSHDRSSILWTDHKWAVCQKQIVAPESKENLLFDWKPRGWMQPTIAHKQVEQNNYASWWETADTDRSTARHKLNHKKATQTRYWKLLKSRNAEKKMQCKDSLKIWILSIFMYSAARLGPYVKTTCLRLNRKKTLEARGWMQPNIAQQHMQRIHHAADWKHYPQS